MYRPTSSTTSRVSQILLLVIFPAVFALVVLAGMAALNLFYAFNALLIGGTILAGLVILGWFDLQRGDVFAMRLALMYALIVGGVMFVAAVVCIVFHADIVVLPLLLGFAAFFHARAVAMRPFAEQGSAEVRVIQGADFARSADIFESVKFYKRRMDAARSRHQGK